MAEQKRKYVLRMEIIRVAEPLYGTGYEKDKIVERGDTRKLIDVSTETDSLDAAIVYGESLLAMVKE